MEENKNISAPEENDVQDYKLVEEAPEEKKEPVSNVKIETAKSRKWKIVGRIFAVVVILLVLGVVFRDFLIENSVRHVGTLVTGTRVKIDSFRSSFNGTVELKNIKVANPAGYQKPYAFEIDRIYVKLLPGTLLSKEPVVEAVEVSGVRIDMEMKGAGRSNLTDIQKNVEKFAAPVTSGKKKEKSKADPDAPAPLIKKIDLTAMSISFSSSTLKSSVPVPLAPIYLRNVGGKGHPLGESLMKVFDALMGAVNNVGGAVMSGVEAVGSAGKVLSDGVADGAGALKKAGKNVSSGISDGVKNISDGIGGLF